MERMDQTLALADAASKLSDEQVGTLIDLARAMSERPFYERAPPAALASLEQGLAEFHRGETVSLGELAERLRTAAE